MELLFDRSVAARKSFSNRLSDRLPHHPLSMLAAFTMEVLDQLAAAAAAAASAAAAAHGYVLRKSSSNHPPESSPGPIQSNPPNESIGVII